MVTRVLSLFVLLICTFAMSQTPNPTPVDGRVSGMVVNGDGKPVADATVPAVIEENRDPDSQLIITPQGCVADSNSPGPRTNGSLSCTVRFLNNGAKPITAIALEWVSYDDTGKVMCCRETTVADYVFPASGSPAIQSGEAFSEKGHSMASATKVGMRIIFEEFADGSTWGDTKDVTRTELVSQRMGAQMVLDRMRDLKKTSTAEQVLQQFGVK